MDNELEKKTSLEEEETYLEIAVLSQRQPVREALEAASDSAPAKY